MPEIEVFTSRTLEPYARIPLILTDLANAMLETVSSYLHISLSKHASNARQVRTRFSLRFRLHIDCHVFFL